MEAKDYGSKAFKKGLECIPMFDTDFVENCIKGDRFGREAIIKMREWVRGWTEANLDKLFNIE